MAAFTGDFVDEKDYRTETQRAIQEVCQDSAEKLIQASLTINSEVREIYQEFARFLVAKNNAYGNSALAPIRFCSDASPLEQLKVRMDDKLSRIIRGKEKDAIPENDIDDLVGYRILQKVAERLGIE